MFCKQLLKVLCKKNHPVFDIDGKGDLGDGGLLNYMQSLSETYNRKLYVINFVKPDESDHYNLLKELDRV